MVVLLCPGVSGSLDTFLVVQYVSEIRAGGFKIVVCHPGSLDPVVGGETWLTAQDTRTKFGMEPTAASRTLTEGVKSVNVKSLATL